MGTITKKSTNACRKQIAMEFLPIGQQLRRDGYPDRHIVDIFNKVVANRQRESTIANPGDSGRCALEKLCANPAAAAGIYQGIERCQIRFKFKVKIAGCVVDFLIDGWLVVIIDCDGVCPDRILDRRLEKLGYKIIHVPAWLASACYEAVVDIIIKTMEEES